MQEFLIYKLQKDNCKQQIGKLTLKFKKILNQIIPNHIWQPEQLQAGPNESSSDNVVYKNSSRVWQTNTVPPDSSFIRTVPGCSVGSQRVLQEGQAGCEAECGGDHDTEPQVPITFSDV